jgi:acetyl/propionyl-CoA carboxylase alpha subunit
VLAIGERDCSLQRRHQKLIEIAPAPNLDQRQRERLHEAAVTIAAAARYRTLGTVEFLLDLDSGDFAFIEANARLQVEHTITEEVTGVDLVQVQIRVGSRRDALQPGPFHDADPRGFAVEARVNLETMAADGAVRPTGGALAAYEPPSGPGVRTDGYGYAGYAQLQLRFPARQGDRHGAEPGGRSPRAGRLWAKFRIEGVETNAAFLRAVLAEPEVGAGQAGHALHRRPRPELVLAEARPLKDGCSMANRRPSPLARSRRPSRAPRLSPRHSRPRSDRSR